MKHKFFYNKKLQIFLILLIVAIGVFYIGDDAIVLAEKKKGLPSMDDAGNWVKKNVLGATGKGLLTLLGVGFFVHFVLGYILIAIGSLLGTFFTMLVGAFISVAQYSVSITNIDFVVEGWVLIRDFCNMFFIIILLVIAFATILRIESYGAKQLLGRLVIMAILINFSRVICGLIVDVTQIMMLTFAETFGNGGKFINFFDFTDIYEFSDYEEAAGEVDNMNTIISAAAGIVFMAIACLVMIALIFVVLVRIVMLWGYTMFSPLAFLLAAFPAGRSYANKFWADYVKYAVSGPVLAFFVWVALGIGNVEHLIETPAGLQGLCSQQAPIKIMCLPNFITFLFATGLLIAGLVVTQQLGGVTSKVTGLALSSSKRMGMGIGKGAGKFGLWAGRKAAHFPIEAGKKVGYGTANEVLKALNVVGKLPIIKQAGGANLDTWATEKRTKMQEYRKHVDDKELRHVNRMSDTELIDGQEATRGSIMESGIRMHEAIVRERLKRNNYDNPEDMNRTLIDAAKIAGAKSFDVNGDISFDDDAELGELVMKMVKANGARIFSKGEKIIKNGKVVETDEKNSFGAWADSLDDSALGDSVRVLKGKDMKYMEEQWKKPEEKRDPKAQKFFKGEGNDYWMRRRTVTDKTKEYNYDRKSRSEFSDSSIKTLRGLQKIDKDGNVEKDDDGNVKWQFYDFERAFDKAEYGKISNVYSQGGEKKAMVKIWLDQNKKNIIDRLNPSLPDNKKISDDITSDDLSDELFGSGKSIFVPGSGDMPGRFRTERGIIGGSARPIMNRAESDSVEVATGVTGLGKIDKGEIDKFKMEKGRIAVDFNDIKGLDPNNAAMYFQGKDKDKAVELIGNHLSDKGMKDDMVNAIKEGLGSLSSLRMYNKGAKFKDKKEQKTAIAHEVFHARSDENLNKFEKRKVWDANSDEEKKVISKRIKTDWENDNMSEDEIIDEYIAEGLTSQTRWAQKDKQGNKTGIQFNDNAVSAMNNVLKGKGNYGDNPIDQFTQKVASHKPKFIEDRAADEQQATIQDRARSLVEVIAETDPALLSAMKELAGNMRQFGDSFSAAKAANDDSFRAVIKSADKSGNVVGSSDGALGEVALLLRGTAISLGSLLSEVRKKEIQRASMKAAA